MKNAAHHFKNKLKPPKKFFDWCESQIPTIVWKNKNETITSNRSGCKVVEKRLTKNSKLTTKYDVSYPFAIILVTSKRIEIQTYTYWSSYQDGKQTIESEMVNMEKYTNGECIKMTRGYYRGTYVLGHLSRMNYMTGPYTNVTFYKNDWLEKINTISELKYLKLGDDLYFRKLEHIYKYHKEIEFLQKIGANRMVSEMLNNRGVDMRIINQNWLRKNKNILKNSEMGFKDFEFEKRIKNRNGKVVPGIKEFLNYNDINAIPKGVGIISFQNWVIKNKIDFKEYKDYLNILKELNIELNENLIKPKNFAKAHDNVVELLNKMEREIEEKRIESRIKSLKRMELIIGGYMFIPPKNANDLIKEGKTLHHCVGGKKYIDDHGKNRTTIIFVRKLNAPDEPLYTLEYRSKQIIQCRGKHNKSAPKEVMDIVNAWKSKIENNRSPKKQDLSIALT